MPIGVERLKKRADFLRVASVRRKWAAPGLVLQAAPAPEDANREISRIGITVTKKVGNAVIRNRVKRRLRAAARDIIPLHGQAGWDYVLIGRQATVNRDFMDLEADLVTAIDKMAKKNSGERRRRND